MLGYDKDFGGADDLIFSVLHGEFGGLFKVAALQLGSEALAFAWHKDSKHLSALQQNTLLSSGILDYPRKPTLSFSPSKRDT